MGSRIGSFFFFVLLLHLSTIIDSLFSFALHRRQWFETDCLCIVLTLSLLFGLPLHLLTIIYSLFFFTLLCSLSNGIKQLNAKSIDVTPLHLSINEYDPLNDFQGLKFRAFEKESLEGRDQNGMIDTSAVCTVQGDIQKATMVFFKKTYPLEA